MDDPPAPGCHLPQRPDVTADDLIFSINRVINPKSPGEAANALSGINAAGMKKLDNRTISVPFAKPYSTFPESLANGITVYMLPVGFDPKNPIGTGPFKYASSRRVSRPSSRATRTTGTRRCRTSTRSS